MHTSTGYSRCNRRASRHRSVTTPPRQFGPDQEEVDRHAVKTSATESSSHVLSLQGRSTRVMSPSITRATLVHEPSVQSADSADATCVTKVGLVQRAAISNGPETGGEGDKRISQLTPSQTQSAIGASQERFEKVGASPIEAHSDENGPTKYNSTTSTGVGATQSTVGGRKKAGVHVNTVVDASTNWYPRDTYDSSIESDQEDMQVEFSTPMDKDDDEEDPSFGVLSNTTFYPLLAYQPHLYGHGLNTEQDGSIIEDIGSGLGADSVMEDATPESRKVDASVAATRTVQPFAWVPPSTSDAFHAIFPGVPFARPQMTGFFEDSVPVFQHRTHSDPYGVDKTISEETRIQQVAPPQDIAWPFVLDGAHPSPSVAGGLPEEPRFVHAKHSPTSEPSGFPNQTTSRSSFPSPSPPMSKVDPVLISLSTCGPIEVHKAEIKDLEGEVCSEPAVTASVQQEVPPSRYV